MELRRRFVFRGNAAAIGGRIVRPTDLILDSIATSSLTVVGGRSRERAAAAKFGEWVSFGEANTFAEGLFDDVQGQIDFTNGAVAEEYLSTSTRVSADVVGLTVGNRPRLTIKRLHAALNSKSPTGSGEPPIAVGADTLIEGVSVDGHALTIELNLPLFQQYDTLSKLMTASDDPRFVKESGDHFFMTQTAPGDAAPPPARLRYCNGVTQATIVKSIKWTGDPIPNARIDQHSVYVPNFGRMFFGELLISDLSRRLTLLRLELGSELGGAVACAEVETNGIWST
jgi:hypothetical protein